jgi:hypothetical protein
VSDGVFAYLAPNGFDGVCHLRVFDSGSRRQRPVVIAGQLSDQAGACSIVNADEWIAAQVQESFFADGREFVYIEHHPQTITGRPEPTFDLVKLERVRKAGRRPASGGGSESGSARRQLVVVSEEGGEAHSMPNVPAAPRWEWELRALRRPPLSVRELGSGRVGLDLLAGVELSVWPAEDYTAYAVAGEEGALAMAAAAQSNSERAAGAIEAAEAVGDASPGAIVDVHPHVPEEDLPDSAA